MNNVIDTNTGRTWGIVSVTELGAKASQFGWTHSLVVMAPAGRKYHTCYATLDGGTVIRMSAPTPAPW
jgi:hypothetical protein